MKKFITLETTVCPLDVPNIDTDQIIPKQFLKKIERQGFGEFLFFDWRYTDNNTPNLDFSLNRPEHQGAKILLTRDNFGCGSSREHAPWALLDFGFYCIIAPSFADIFYNNCFQNGILPIHLPTKEINLLFSVIHKNPKTSFFVNLPNKNIIIQGENIEKIQISFDIDGSKKEKLLKGLDDITTTLLFEKQIEAYESERLIQIG